MRATGRARVSARSPSAFGVCDDCGTWWNRIRLVDEEEYQGNSIRRTGFVVCPRCLDVPQPQLSSPILPNDPWPVMDPRPEPFLGNYGYGLASYSGPSSAGDPSSLAP